MRNKSGVRHSDPIHNLNSGTDILRFQLTGQEEGPKVNKEEGFFPEAFFFLQSLMCTHAFIHMSSQ